MLLCKVKLVTSHPLWLAPPPGQQSILFASGISEGQLPPLEGGTVPGAMLTQLISSLINTTQKG